MSTTELELAEETIICSIQQEAFEKEIEFVKSKCPRGKNTPILVNQFDLFIDNKGILRCRSRLSNASVAESSKSPILMPLRHRYSEMIILDAHRKVYHNGIRETLMQSD